MIKIYSAYLLSTILPVLQTMLLTVSIVFGSLLAVNPDLYAADKTPQNILVLGDSLSGAFGLNSDDGWVALLQQKISRQKYDYRVINASVSGDTTRTGLGRIQSALQMHSPSIVIIALGGNDGLRGLPFREIENSLRKLIQHCQTQGAQVLLVGVRLPPNYGAAYNQKFAEIYIRLADSFQIPLVTKMLDKVAENRQLMQADGMHPKAEAQPQVMENIWAGLKPLL
ncbi:MAG: arylesterase [Gammaproteobacteria bacterium]|nr:arylesterase [Gammaproteobacteria bacterium]